MAITPQVAIAAREAGDYKYTSRQSDWQGGYNRLYFQQLAVITEPRFWDSFNVTTSIQGEIQLAPLFERVQTDASDKQPLLLPFNGALYRLEGTTTTAVQKTTDGTTWNAVTMTSGPTNGIRGVVVWKNQLIAVTGLNNAVYALAAADTWSSIGGALPVANNVDMVGVGPDDKLLAWFNAKGLYSYDGTTWAKIFPPSGVDPDEASCDIIDGSTGSVVFVTRDAKGSSISEYFTPEGAATQGSVVTWSSEKDTFFYICRLYSGAAYLGAKKGFGGGVATAGQGLLYRKERGASPEIVQEFGDGIRGAVASLDFGVHALVNDGTDMFVGVSQRAPSLSGVIGVPGIYWYNVDLQTGLESISPDAATDTAPGNVAGTVYSAAVINGEVLITTPTGTWKRSKTKKATTGYLDTSIYDLNAPDHVKSWRFIEVLVESATATESVAVYYRVGTLSGSWLGGTSATASGAKKIPFPDDAPTLAQYKLNSRQIQLHLVMARGATDTLQPRITSVAIDAAQVKPVGTN